VTDRRINVRLLTRSTLAKALWATLAVVVVLMLLPASLSAWQLWSAATEVDYIGKVSVAGAHTIGQVETLMNVYRKEQWEYLALKPGDKDRADTVDSMAEERDDMVGLFTSYRALPVSAAERSTVAKFETDWNAYVEATNDEVTLVDAGRFDEASATFNGTTGDGLWHTLKADLVQWRTQATAVANTYRIKADRWALASLITITVLLVAALVVAGYVGRLLNRRLSGGLGLLSAAADGIANGDVDRVPAHSRR
jgi:methyl-accepting chemotaxis protein